MPGILDPGATQPTKVINVENDIIGQQHYLSPNGVEFSSGMHIKFGANTIPTSYIGPTYIVENVGRKITLQDTTEINRTVGYIKFVDTPFDKSSLPEGSVDPISGFDATGFDGEPAQDRSMIDYLTVQRGASNSNVWSRLNCWYHKDVLEAAVDRTRYVDRYSLYESDIIGWDDSYMANGSTDLTRGWDSTQFDGIRFKEQRPPFSLDHSRQAKRPIVNFSMIFSYLIQALSF